MTKRQDVKKVLMIGAGTVNIGGAGELDFMACEAAKRLMEMGYETVIVNPDAQALSNSAFCGGKVYTEPLGVENIEKIIEKEKPDILLPFFGGKLAMTLCHELASKGILAKHGVRPIGVSVYAMECCEDPVKFKNIMDSLGIATHEGIVVHSVEEAESAAAKYDYHVVIRSPYSRYSNANSLVFNKEELKRFIEPVLNASTSASALISEALIERNEYEFEVIRDAKNNIMTIASVEDINPLDVHSSDSAAVTPAVTLSEEEYKQFEEAAFRIAEALQIVGAADVRFAKNPKNGEWVVVKVTPSVSRIFAYAADTKGINLACIAASVIFGESISDIAQLENYDEKKSFYSVRVPVFPFDSFPDAADILDTKMRSAGSAQGIGKTFGEALQKALRAGGCYGLAKACGYSAEELLTRLITPSSNDLHFIYEALRKNASVEEISRITCIDQYFIAHMRELLMMENRLLKYRARVPVEPVLIKSVKEGFSKKYIAGLLSVGEKEIRESVKDIQPCENVIEIGDNRFALTYHSGAQQKRLGGKTALVVGGGANRIGQSSELKFAAECGARALGERGYKTIYINPVNVSGGVFDRVYLEAVTPEDVLEVCRIEQPDIIITQFAGSCAGEIAATLEKDGFTVSGADSAAYAVLADKHSFMEMTQRLNIPSPRTENVTDIDEALAVAESIGYPVWVSGRLASSGKTIYASGEMLNYLETSGISQENPIRVENFLFSAVECELDAVYMDGELFVPEIMEHIESAGINSGDSACVIPPRSITEENRRTIYDYARSVVSELKIKGNVNMRFAVDRDKIYLMAVKIGASRTLPFVSKMCGIDLAGLGACAAAGEKAEFAAADGRGSVGVKEVVCPWEVFDECDPILGPDMRSTGSVMSVGKTFGEAFFKAQEAAGARLPLGKNVYINLSERDNIHLGALCREFISAGFGILTTAEHKKELEELGIKAERVKRLDGGRPNIGDAIINGEVDIVVNTAAGDSDIRRLVIRNSVAYMTTVPAAFAAVSGIKAAKEE